jgi:hypothetical protein
MKAVLLALALSLPVNAQGLRATVRGSVTDPRGAVIINAMCILRDLGSGLELSALTDDDGRFAFTVIPGAYRLTVARSGFATETRDLRVAAGGDLIADVVLRPAPLSEQVVVVSGSRREELRESATAAVGVISQDAMAEGLGLRLNVRGTFFSRWWLSPTDRAAGYRFGIFMGPSD